MIVQLMVAALVLSTVAVVLSFSSMPRRWTWLPQTLTAVAGTVLICALIEARADYEWIVAASALTGSAWLLAALRWADR